MNFIFISPNYPRRYFKWVQSLRRHGVNVFGIGDSPYGELEPKLRADLIEYYYLPDLSDKGRMLEACRYFERKYGRIDYIESDNEWWLEMDAYLRKELGVDTGFHPEQMHKIKAKSAMKECFRQGGAKTMRFVLLNGPLDLEKARAFIDSVGYPVFVKPDVGVGASDSFAIKSDEELRRFLANPLPETYIMEEYIRGSIVSFDGICGKDGEVLFATSDHFPIPIADVVNEDRDFCYYTNPFALPFVEGDEAAFEKMGRAVVKAFGISNRFFHIEFFLLLEDKKGLAKKGEFVALECNMRPPGGYTPDLIDFANGLSCYEIYADAICYGENRQDLAKEKHYAFSSCRRDEYRYAHSHEDILNAFHEAICAYGRYPKEMAVAMGDSYYFARFKSVDEGMRFDAYVRQKAR